MSAARSWTVGCLLLAVVSWVILRYGVTSQVSIDSSGIVIQHSGIGRVASIAFDLSGSAALFCMVLMWTFLACAAALARGRGYATRQVALSVLTTPVFGIGVFALPGLVRRELERDDLGHASERATITGES